MIIKLKEKETAGYDWIDIRDPQKEELNEVASQFDLHYALVKDSLQPEHLPKYEMINDVQFVILRIYDETAAKDSDTIQEVTNKIAIFIGKDFIITIHRASTGFIEDIKDRYVDSGKCHNHHDILHRVVSGVLLSYDIPMDKLIYELDYYEAKIFLKEKTPSLLKNLYFIKRKASVINRILILSKIILENLENKISAPYVQDMRDTLVRIRTNAEQTNDNVGNLLNIYISLSSQKTNEVVRILTVFSVFFMPLTFIVGIYGMNFKYMPELSWRHGYADAMILMAVVTLIIYLWFKRKGWL